MLCIFNVIYIQVPTSNVPCWLSILDSTNHCPDGMLGVRTLTQVLVIVIIITGLMINFSCK